LLSILTAGAQIKDLQFGLAIIQNSSLGLISIGYPENEGLVHQNKSAYPNLLDQMVSQGVVESRTYSLYLNDINNPTRTIIFGGLDLEGFCGTLYTFPLNLPKNGGPITGFVITLTGITVNSSYGCSTVIGPPSSFPVNALHDSGISLVALTQGLADALAAEINATQDADGFYNLPSCDSLPTNGSLSFDFSGLKINVPFSELVIQHPDGTCTLGVVPIDGSCAFLGDTFLRSAYVVFDLV